jgi:hypothetical protein
MFNFTSLPLYFHAYSPRHLFHSGDYGEKEHFCPCQLSNPDRLARNLVAIATELSQLRIVSLIIKEEPIEVQLNVTVDCLLPEEAEKILLKLRVHKITKLFNLNAFAPIFNCFVYAIISTSLDVDNILYG